MKDVDIQSTRATEIFWFDDNRGIQSKQQQFLLLEVPPDVINQLELKLDSMPDDIHTVCKLLKAKDEGTSSSNDDDTEEFTTSISPNQLLVVELQKVSNSLTFGVLAATSLGSCLSDQMDDNVETRLLPSIRAVESDVFNHSSLDCVYVGEKQSILTLQPTHPRFQQLFSDLQCNLSSQCLIRASVAEQGFTIDELLTRLQIARRQLEQFLLQGYFVCNPVSPQRLLWLPVSLVDINAVMTLVITGMRLDAASWQAFDVHSAVKWINSTLYRTPQLSLEPSAILSLLASPHILIQLLLFFCESNHPEFHLDVIAKNSPTEAAYNQYIKCVESAASPTSPLTFSLNKEKITRVLARHEMLQRLGLPAPIEECMAAISESLNALLPIELLDHERDEEKKTFFSRGDGSVDVSKNNFYFSTVHKGYFSILRHLLGFAVYSNSSSPTHLLTLFHFYHLPWDWERRLEEMFKLKPRWSMFELDNYLEPLRAFCDNVPVTEEVVAKYLVQKGTLQPDGHSLYFNRRLVLKLEGKAKIDDENNWRY